MDLPHFVMKIATLRDLPFTIFILIKNKNKREQTRPWAPVSRRDLHTFSVTYFWGTHPSCLWPASIISSVQPPVFSLLIESLPKPTGMFKVAVLEINHLTPFLDPKDLASRPFLLWGRESGGGGAVSRRQGRRIKGGLLSSLLELLRPRPLRLRPCLLKVNTPKLTRLSQVKKNYL